MCKYTRKRKEEKWHRVGVGGEKGERRSSWRKKSRGRKEREKEWMRGGGGRRTGVEGETAVGGGVEKTCFCSHLCVSHSRHLSRCLTVM